MFSYTYILSKKHSRSLLNFFLIGNPTLNCVNSTSLEKSKPSLLTQILSKSLAALLMYFISFQNTLISIGFISKGAVFVGPICSRIF